MTRIYQHYYKDEPLYLYCKRKGYIYTSILQYVNYKKMTVEDAIAYYLSKRGTKHLNNVKYIINGVTVRSVFTKKQYSKFTQRVFYHPKKDWHDIYDEVKNAEE